MNLKDKLRKIRDRVLWEKWFFNRGKSIWSELVEIMTVTTIVGLFVERLNNWFGLNIDAGKAMIAVPPLMIIYWITGRIDYKKLHIIQVENEISLKANPALYEKICKILEELQIIKYKLK